MSVTELLDQARLAVQLSEDVGANTQELRELRMAVTFVIEATEQHVKASALLADAIEYLDLRQ